MQIAHVTLDNYDSDTYADHNEEREVIHHNWVDEVVRSEGRVGEDGSPSCFVSGQRFEKKDPSFLTRYFSPKSHQRCIHSIQGKNASHVYPIGALLCFDLYPGLAI